MSTALDPSQGVKSTDPMVPAESYDIEALKLKISELESLVKFSNLRHVPTARGLTETQHYRFESCLYRHRKEWEEKEGPGSWRMFPEPREYGRPMPNGPWSHTWYIDSDNKYRKPDPFDPAHECTTPEDAEPAPTITAGTDEFDFVIDYGDRRERLRKNFEWEMDRLFLAEEIERRKRAEAAEAELQLQATSQQGEGRDKRPLEVVAGVDLDDSNDDTISYDPMMEPKINHLEWREFKHHQIPQGKNACVIDVLVGEPVDSPFAAPHRTHHHEALDQISRSDPGCEPLPERVRIHSLVLLRIFYRLLGSRGTGLVNDRRFPVFTNPIVLVRPFKTLIYCEQGLREWRNELQEQHFPSSEPRQVLKRQTTAAEDDEDRNKLTRSLTALQHVECLLSFLNTDIVPRLKYLDGPHCHRVTFSDLWLLFKPGVEVIGADGHQVYRVLYANDDGQHDSTEWEQGWYNPLNNKHHKTLFQITCVFIDFDGKNLGPVTRTFKFKRFEGERDVISLDVYPLRFHALHRAEFSDMEWESTLNLPTEERYRHKFAARGARFLDTAAIKHMYYAGPTLVARDHVESQVVIDFETAFSAKGQHVLKPCLETLLGNPVSDESDGADTKAKFAEDEVHDDDFVDHKQKTDYIMSLLPKTRDVDNVVTPALAPLPLKDLHARIAKTGQGLSVSDLMIMSHRVFGFVLRSRKWAQLDLAYLREVHLPSDEATGNDERREPTAFDRLVLEEGHRPMIVSLIAQHFRDKASATGQREKFDIVQGKGKGLILLLHGAPGVGKTSTAEGVAELFRKPLFQITCGDLGTTAREVEEALETNFNMANRWGCILLLDEADVFLAERTKEDFKRNGLVAAFLRVLEYYSGILFLTTNRIGDFDEAFTSRIHISLYYPALNQNKTVDIFKINLDMIEERFAAKGRQIHIDQIGIGGFACQHFVEHPQARWNGRQIRNACQTALALAEFEAQGNSPTSVANPDAPVTLKVEHFKTVRDAYLEFSRYMNDLYGSSAARRAKEGRLRAIWVDDNDRVVGDTKTSDKRAAFLLASQGLSPARHEAQPSPAQQGYPLHQHDYVSQRPQFPPSDMHSRSEQYTRQYRNPDAPSMGYRDSASPMPIPAQQRWGSADSGATHVPFRGADESQHGAGQRMPQPQQQARHHSQPWLPQGMQDQYAPPDN